jgi:hypothetical protein
VAEQVVVTLVAAPERVTWLGSWDWVRHARQDLPPRPAEATQP